MANGTQVGDTQVFNVTMSCDTSAYASGDVVADTQQLDGFFMPRKRKDKDNETVA